jgi:hypothetical protein
MFFGLPVRNWIVPFWMAEYACGVICDVLNIVSGALEPQVVLFGCNLCEVYEILFGLLAQGDVADTLGIASGSEDIHYAKQREQDYRYRYQSEQRNEQPSSDALPQDQGSYQY